MNALLVPLRMLRSVLARRSLRIVGASSALGECFMASPASESGSGPLPRGSRIEPGTCRPAGPERDARWHRWRGGTGPRRRAAPHHRQAAARDPPGRRARAPQGRRRVLCAGLRGAAAVRGLRRCRVDRPGGRPGHAGALAGSLLAERSGHARQRIHDRPGVDPSDEHALPAPGDDRHPHPDARLVAGSSLADLVRGRRAGGHARLPARARGRDRRAWPGMPLT